MRKIGVLVITVLVLFLMLIFLLNIKVTTLKGIDYKVKALKIPLYLKILDFYDRHYNYAWLTKEITQGKASQREKVMAVFAWTVENLKEKPETLRAVDDHVWHTIIRGYATRDQYSDVFSTLCNYAGIRAFFLKDRYRHYFSFVNVDGQWCVFDPAQGAFFASETGSLIPVPGFKNGWRIFDIKGRRSQELEAAYAQHAQELAQIDFEGSFHWSRANIQSPLMRMRYGFKKWAGK